MGGNCNAPIEPMTSRLSTATPPYRLRHRRKEGASASPTAAARGPAAGAYAASARAASADIRHQHTSPLRRPQRLHNSNGRNRHGRSRSAKSERALPRPWTSYPRFRCDWSELEKRQSCRRRRRARGREVAPAPDLPYLYTRLPSHVVCTQSVHSTGTPHAILGKLQFSR